MSTSVRDRRRRAARLRDAETSARARVLPDASPRRPSEPSRFPSPLSAAIDKYRQTPEAWEAVWKDEA